MLKQKKQVTWKAHFTLELQLGGHKFFSENSYNKNIDDMIFLETSFKKLHPEEKKLQCCLFIMLCLGSIGLDHVKSELRHHDNFTKES